MEKGMFEIRNYREQDENFIFATMLNGLYYGNELFNSMPRDVFFDNYRRVVKGLVDGASVKVVCLKDDIDVAVGYAILSPKILHFIYVKEAWRKLGIAKELVPKDIEYVTHLTKVGKAIKKKKWKFNPFLI